MLKVLKTPFRLTGSLPFPLERSDCTTHWWMLASNNWESASDGKTALSSDKKKEYETSFNFQSIECNSNIVALLFAEICVFEKLMSADSSQM